MPDDEAIARVRTLGRDLAALSLQDEQMQAVAGLVVGAAYALVRALELEYADATGTKRSADYGHLLNQAAVSVGQGASVPPAWASPFYFNDSLIRLAVSAERMDKQEPHRGARPATVREEVNIFKHEFGGLFLRGRRLGVTEAIRELEQVLSRLKALASG